MSMLNEKIDQAKEKHAEVPNKITLHLFVHADKVYEDVGINISDDLPAEEMRQALRVLWELLRGGCTLDTIILSNHTTEDIITRRVK